MEPTRTIVAGMPVTIVRETEHERENTVEIGLASSHIGASQVVIAESLIGNIHQWIKRLPMVALFALTFGFMVYWLRLVGFAGGTILGLVVSSQRLFKRQSLVISNADIRVVERPWARGRRDHEISKLRGRVADVQHWVIAQHDFTSVLSIELADGINYRVEFDHRSVDSGALLNTLACWFPVPPGLRCGKQ